MKFDVTFERTFPHPLGKVWRALTDPKLLGRWLMETDFVPEPGRSFRMWCRDGKGDTELYACDLLEYEPPHRMLWRWVLDGRQGDGETRVEFTLKEIEGGTHLTIRHSGDRDRETIEAFKNGWPVKLDKLEEAMRSDDFGRS